MCSDIVLQCSVDRCASWHCCYAPCPAADWPGSCAILVAICLSSGAELSLSILQHQQNPTPARSKNAAAAQEPPAHNSAFTAAQIHFQQEPDINSHQQTAARPDEREQPEATIAQQHLPNTAKTAVHEQAASGSLIERHEVSGTVLSSAVSIAHLIMSEVKHIRAAAAAAVGRDLTAPCRVTVQRLGSMHEAEGAAWRHVCSSLKQSPAAAATVSCELVCDLAVACCSVDAPVT